MKYKWSNIVDEFKTLLWANLRFDNEEVKARVKYLLLQTDVFHPWETDGELSRALDKLPSYCNYRSIEPYWAFKYGRDEVLDGLYAMFEESFDRMVEYMDTKWNFAPGDHDKVEIQLHSDWAIYTDKCFAKIRKAAKKA